MSIKSKKGQIWIIGLVVILLLIGGFLFFDKQKTSTKQEVYFVESGTRCEDFNFWQCGIDNTILEGWMQTREQIRIGNFVGEPIFTDRGFRMPVCNGNTYIVTDCKLEFELPLK